MRTLLRRIGWPLLLAAPALIVGPIAASYAYATGHPHAYVRKVTGTPTNGFHIRWSDGHSDFTPTRSEALAECSGYDHASERWMCRGSVHTQYHDWVVLQRSLRNN